MKKLLLMLTISAFVATTVVAQDQTPVKQDKVEWERKIKDELKLTPDQVLKFDALSKEYKDKMTTLESDATITKEAQKEKKMALKKEKETKLNEFLTPEQQTKYKELMERKKAEAKPAEAKPAS
jgi:Spy/CpxP family protein refolding chaperone